MSADEITEAMTHWQLAFSTDCSDEICALYDAQACLWGTLSPIRRDTADSIKSYFDQIFAFHNRQLEFNNSAIRMFGDVAISNGFYTFAWLDSGNPVTITARFSFIYTKKQGRWLIIEHHSSTLPDTL